MSYIDGIIIPVPEANKEAYREMAQRMGALFREYGAVEVIDCWGDDVPHGKATDFFKAVDAQEGETVVFSWIRWESKEARDTAWEKAMKDERMQPGATPAPFDGKRMFWGGFTPISEFVADRQPA